VPLCAIKGAAIACAGDTLRTSDLGLQANVCNGHFTSRAGESLLACGRHYERLEAVDQFHGRLVLIAITIAMVVVARPKDGVSAPFLKVWVVGRAYALNAIVSAVIGVRIHHFQLAVLIAADN